MLHSNARHTRAPVVKYNNEYIEELDRKAFYVGRLIPSWPRQKTGGRHHKTPAKQTMHGTPAKQSPHATHAMQHKTPHDAPAKQSPHAMHHKTPHDATHNASAAVLKLNIEFKLLFGILREIVPDAENTAIRRAIIDERAPQTFTQDYTNSRLLNFIKKFNVKSILAPRHIMHDIHESFKNVVIDDIDAQPVKKYDLVIAAHCDMVKYASHSNKYIIGYYFNTTPERLEIYRKLYIAIKGETPAVMNIPRETLRTNLNSVMKFMAETEDVQNVNNTLNAYAVCYTIK